MKLQFKLNALVAAILSPSVQQDKVEQACEAYRNGMEVTETKQDRTLRIAGGKDNRRADERETLKIRRTGEDNVVARFIAYNDEIGKLSERAGKVESDIVLRVLPSEFGQWVSKFDKNAPKSKKSAKNGETEQAEGNRLAPVPA